MSKAIHYDLTTFEGTIQSLGKYLSITEREISKYIANNKDNYDCDEFIELFQITDEHLLSSELIMSSLHVTTNNDGCSSIKKYGLINLQQAILLDTPLNKYLQNNGVQIDLAKKQVHYKGGIYDIAKDYRGLSGRDSAEWVSFKLFEDYQINSFFFSENVLNYGGNVNESPEFLYNLAQLLKDGKIQYDWVNDNNKKCYVIKFEAPISNIKNFYNRIYTENLEETEINLMNRKWIIEKSLSIINEGVFYSRQTDEIYCELKPNVSVPFSNIMKIYSPNEYLKEYKVIKK
ncbi:hypothetical protein [Bacillus halotolerans]|uniref:hypothetical protein n=1 Tax=Bacillus halotolerans TaxID=260554 RepID=UPI00223280AE|nr:hypothetical protein [Bacillus halotolerans]UZD51716.1 hypothetical protein OMK57_01165 [Bacillus halotolerans]